MKKLTLLIRQILPRLLAGCNFLRTSKHGGTVSEQVEVACDVTVDSKGFGFLIDEIVRLMSEERIYKHPQLDLKHLSQRLQTPAYLVTKAINEGLGVNFYDLVNRYRVEEVKSLLVSHDSKRFTIMAVAFDAGFNSKTTFNTAFKKVTGLTPSSYRNQYCHGSADKCKALNV
jgi:AraC-like DNA-binding protein